VVTGGEALYADIGHFGRLPIRLTWFSFVLPALLLNYFGQGALLLNDPEALVNRDYNPFYHLVPQWGLYPMVVLATAATVIASQAVISGVFSLTRQAVQLGYMPRVLIEHTSARQIGQIYVPAVNWGLMIACIGLVWGFRSSSALAAAYGVAVTTDMVFTTILLAVVARMVWRWSLPLILALGTTFFIVDIAFWGANITKVPDGGWFPIVIALGAFTLMSTWHRGRAILHDRMKTDALPIDLFLSSVKSRPPHRVPGTSVFLFRNTDGTPPALLHNLKHNKVLHERVVLMTVLTEEVPHVPEEKRYRVESLGEGIYRIVIRYGFMEDVDIPKVLSQVTEEGMEFREAETTYFVGRETVIASAHPGMALWREKLFGWMSRNAMSAAAFFRIPPNRVVELGAQIEM
jgi:KUP system potassium uptake protein